MAEKQPEKALTPIDKMKTVLSAESVQQQFKNALADSAPLFIASLIDVYGSDSNLQQCPPALVVQEALKAATLRLPINRNLGFAYIIPYKKSVKNPDNSWSKVSIPQFQMGYRAFIQLAMRTGQYRFINADAVYEGENVSRNRVTGEVTITGEPKSDKTIGYLAYMEMLNGFSKGEYWPLEKVTSHAKRFSKSWSAKDGSWIKDSGWDTSFDAMAVKTVLKSLLSKYGYLSVEMLTALSSDTDDEQQARQDIQANANQEVIDIEPEPTQPTRANGTQTEQPKSPETADPGF